MRVDCVYFFVIYPCPFLKENLSRSIVFTGCLGQANTGTFIPVFFIYFSFLGDGLGVTKNRICT